MRVLIIGGYGNFGFRLAKLLGPDARLTVILAGRNLGKAQAACTDLNTYAAIFKPLKLNRNRDLTSQIEVAPDIIVDTSGPFQAYDHAPYAVVEYAISQGCHYLDIADCVDFVAGISAYDTKAKQAGITALSGLSTYPCLTSAVLLHFQDRFDDVTHVKSGIAPSPKAGLGLNVIKAITSYAGKRVHLFKDGKKQHTYGLTESFKHRIRPPGADPLDIRLFSNVDAPETSLWPTHFPKLHSLWFGAGPKPMILHRLLILFSKMVRWKLLPGISGISGLISRILDACKFGAHRGGMFVELSGKSGSRNKTLSWHLIAEGDDGPNIPIIPVAITVSRILNGNPPEPGARPAIGAVSLDAYSKMFETFDMTSGIWDSEEPCENLYPKALGSAYDALPETLQSLHRIDKKSVFEGRAKVTRGHSPIAWLTGLVFRFPKTTEDTPIKVVLTNNGGVETWDRHFDGRKMVSLQEYGQGDWDGLIVEKFGPVSIAMAAIAKNGEMHLVTKGWRCLGIPLPRILAPGGDIFEHEDAGRFNFHVDICAPLLGRLVKYEGWLQPIKE